MDSTIKALLAKAWKDEDLDLATGRHYFDETVTVRVIGSVEKQGPTSLLPPQQASLWSPPGPVLGKVGHRTGSRLEDAPGSDHRSHGGRHR